MPGGGVVHAPLGWIAEFADLPEGTTARRLGDALVRAGLEVEGIEAPGDALHGPIVIGRVESLQPEPQKNGKTINWCQVDVGPHNNGGEPRGIVCGADNFTAGDLVVVALPGAVLPGGFEIAARKTYGHVSDGMICSVRELGIGDDHGGILVLDQGTPGADALDELGLNEAVLTIAVTPDRGYCLSMRGLAREAATALGVGFHDIAEIAVPAADAGAYPVIVDDPSGCDQFSARAITGLDPGAPSPDWMQARLRAAGMRSISLAVDVTNYVMLETGQPLHAFDRSKLTGPIRVRRAAAGEKITTLDASVRVLDPDDLVVADDSGPIAVAGVMGGASTEIGDRTSDIVLEAAHWDPGSIARAVRRHRLPSEAAKRFERGVDPGIAGVALQRCVDLLVQCGGAAAAPGYTVVGAGPDRVTIRLAVTRPSELAGLPIAAGVVTSTLREVGCAVTGTDVLAVTPPTWRRDLIDPADLVEEVVRLVGYDQLPSSLPTPPPGRGLTAAQQWRRAVSRSVAAAGYTEVLNYPFDAPEIHDTLRVPAGDERRNATRLVNPLSDAQPELRTSLLPGLLATLVRNVGRGNRDLALFEMGLIYLARPATPRPVVGVEQRPTDDQLAALYALVPDQPRHLGAVLAGSLERSGWWGAGRPATWTDAVELARVIARTARVEIDIRPAEYAPWHPGRCAELRLNGQVIGHAGELDPRVVQAMGLPERTCAIEVDLDAFDPPEPARAPQLSSFPPVLLDLALVVPAGVLAGDVLAAVREGAGELLEAVRLFDVYSDAGRLGPDVKSLAFALRFRAPDRTLTVEEATDARDAAIARTAELFGARLRG
jgi:phenylalanyl-tRNA synthetase beta chain